ncbi:hypothetical protein EVAR_3449_1 [Eumeta japonica]|uniref:Uncharacterized protein n=1 Tax=Eumeta variegata TaxID=151549 RepID=A0A4C1SV82_EUMVA|nr:hypothetical protein EVAR_3449_1 [Eumeta japonica]
MCDETRITEAHGTDSACAQRPYNRVGALSRKDGANEVDSGRWQKDIQHVPDAVGAGKPTRRYMFSINKCGHSESRNRSNAKPRPHHLPLSNTRGAAPRTDSINHALRRPRIYSRRVSRGGP